MNLEELQAGKVLLIDKPLDWTSFDVVNKIRWAIKKKYDLKKIKVGHAGTLDPKATGLLIVCIGKQTKNIVHYQGQDKTYSATLKLGATTPSYDIETEENALFSISHLTDQMIHKTISQFIGKIQQYPPVFSALKTQGRRLYEFARKGEKVDITPRTVCIYNFKITRIELPYVSFSVKCGKGTYIRSLANDFGKALESGGYLTALRREQIGGFSLTQALCLEKAIELITQ